MSVDRPSRFVVAWAAGPREVALADTVIRTTRARTAGQAGIPWISDGWAAYPETIIDTYCAPCPAGIGTWDILLPTAGVRLTQAVKHRRGRRLVRVEVRATIGAAAAQPYTVHVERFNGVLRDRLACLTRKTHAFAKESATWDAALSLALFEHNWLRPHPALRQPLAIPDPAARRYQRRTPAVAVGRTDHVWAWTEFLTHPVSHQQRG